MWLLPPPRYSCCSAYAEKRKGSWRVLGRRPALLPTRRAEGNPPTSLPQSLHLRMVSDNQARKKEKKKKSKQCFPKTCQDYPKVSALSLLRLLWLQPSKPRAQCFKSLIIQSTSEGGYMLRRQIVKRGCRFISAGPEHHLQPVEKVRWRASILKLRYWTSGSDSRLLCCS